MILDWNEYLYKIMGIVSSLLSAIEDRCLATLGRDGHFQYNKLKKLFPIDIWILIICYLDRENNTIKLCEMLDLKEIDYMSLIILKYPCSQFLLI